MPWTSRRPVLQLPRLEIVLVFVHVDALAAKSDTFHLQPHPLLQASLELQLDLPARTDHPLPRKVAVSPAQERGYMPMIERISGGGCYLPVGRNFAARNLPDRLSKGCVALLALGRLHEAANHLVPRQPFHVSSL